MLRTLIVVVWVIPLVVNSTRVYRAWQQGGIAQPAVGAAISIAMALFFFVVLWA